MYEIQVANPGADICTLLVTKSVVTYLNYRSQVQQAKFNQRRISVIKYLGELYNYKLLDSSVVFHVLFSLITFGSWLFDPPHNLFRIRLVCTLLDTCGQFFNGGLAKKKLDCFLVYFQVSILSLFCPIFIIWEQNQPLKRPKSNVFLPDACQLRSR